MHIALSIILSIVFNSDSLVCWLIDLFFHNFSDVFKLANVFLLLEQTFLSYNHDYRIPFFVFPINFLPDHVRRLNSKCGVVNS